MRWSERQRAMLAEMDLRVWQPLAPAVTPGSALADAAVEGRRPDVARPGAASAKLDEPGPAAAEIQFLDWPALAARAAVCTDCALCAGRTRSVFGAGRVKADWMIVGEAPDEDDDRSGEPFSGMAGQLLDNMLDAIRLTRTTAPSKRQVYVTHAVKCHPPGGRSPERGEVECCERFLLRQMELVQPRLILTMGRIAAQVLLRSSEAFGKLRGRVHRYHDIPLVATYHPGYLLRHPEDKAAAWDDLCLAVETERAAGALAEGVPQRLL